MKSRALPLFGMLMLGALTGCADGDETRLIQVGGDGTDRGLSTPATLTVETGTEVRWHNVGTHTHVLIGGAAEDAADQNADGEPDEMFAFDPEWGPSRLVPGATISHVFDSEGSYVYWLDQSRTFGTIIVEAPS
ncbi:hypothetical protein M4I32_10670 [Microbacterium sp. LRZ72]|uniref:cupredoxin domain-containing protein n=1 Tax=Microbacterium sp. LRZ72 TaxID=2942481 RepID=UPI0029A1A3CF|nr:hypothetical protein [Microbacterium sp. LRZ72]MDX2377262.1 hypothetical protein [Microbacterium sp. LRZ72]